MAMTVSVVLVVIFPKTKNGPMNVIFPIIGQNPELFLYNVIVLNLIKR